MIKEFIRLHSKSCDYLYFRTQIRKNGERKVVPARSTGRSAQGFFPRKHAVTMTVRNFFWTTAKFPVSSVIFELAYFSLKGCVISASLLKNKVSSPRYFLLAPSIRLQKNVVSTASVLPKISKLRIFRRVLIFPFDKS